jgi:hypothetical protein
MQIGNDQRMVDFFSCSGPSIIFIAHA